MRFAKIAGALIAVSIANAQQSSASQDALSILGDILFYIFGLQFMNVDPPFVAAAFIRVCVFILVFVTAFAGLRLIPVFNVLPRNAAAGAHPNFTKGPAVIFALALAVLGSFTISTDVILGIGGIFGFVTAFLLIAIPVAPILIGIMVMPSTRGFIVVKIMLVLLAIILLSLARPLFVGDMSAFIGVAQ